MDGDRGRRPLAPRTVAPPRRAPGPDGFAAFCAGMRLEVSR